MNHALRENISRKKTVCRQRELFEEHLAVILQSENTSKITAQAKHEKVFLTNQPLATAWQTDAL